MSLISIVIPLYNEEESLVELYSQIKAALEDSRYEFEILFIDDGSTDKSGEIIEEMADTDLRVKAIRFQRNYGKAAALNTGFKRCKGDFVMTMDADLQDDPAEIIPMVEMLGAEWDMVSGWKKTRHDPIGKRWPSKFFNFVVARSSGIGIHDFNCGLKAYKGKVVKNIEVYGELHRFIPVLAKQRGFTCTEKVVEHHARKYGHSKYGFGRMFSGMFDFLTVTFLGKYLRKPMHFFGLLGLIIGMIGFLILLYLGIQWVRQYFYATGQWIGNRPIFYIGILLSIIGVQFVSMGLLGELITTNMRREEPVIRDKD